MSLTEPRFGEVFRFVRRVDLSALIMYIGPAKAPAGDWIGLRLVGEYEWEEPGEVAQRIPLIEPGSRWEEVPDDTD